jgi:hypothetical protein
MLHDRSAACVIAQQYSSATFISLHFRSRHCKIMHEIKKYTFFQFV